MIPAIILARKGSKGIKNKNLRIKWQTINLLDNFSTKNQI